MKPIFLAVFALALACFLIAPHAADFEQTEYLAGLEDVPLMPGLKASPSAMTDFDQPEGRIVEATASGVVDPGHVEQYYARTLPQLGWKPLPNGQYARESENLEVEVKPFGPGSTVRFTVAPAAASSR